MTPSWETGRQTANYVRRLLRQHNPKARTLLELACGTGAILKILARYL